MGVFNIIIVGGMLFANDFVREKPAEAYRRCI